jgi:murein hydrolase activator
VRQLVLVLLLLGAATWVRAQATPQRTQKQVEAQKQLGAVRAQIKSLSDEQKRLDDARDAAASKLRDVDGKVAVSQRSLRDTDSRIAQQEAELLRLQQRQDELEESLAKQREELAQLVRSAYAIGQHGQLQLLLEQGRMSDLARVLAYHRYFQQDRQRRITGLTAELQSLATVAEQVRQQQQALVSARAKQQSQLAALGSQKRERAGLVTTLEEKYRDRDQRLAALGRDEKNTVALLERLRKLMARMPKPPATPRTPGAKTHGIRPPVVTGNPNIPIGPLNLPLAGTVLAGYGGTMPDGHASQGLLIAGSAGAEVHAVSAGRVAYADWLKGYGLLIILDHGNGWMTLYAFNDALLKNTGDTVRAGESISTVGSSGAQGRPALYFELRRNGQPQDPRSWLKK